MNTPTATQQMRPEANVLTPWLRTGGTHHQCFYMSKMHCAESWSIHYHSLINHLGCLSCMQLTKSCSFQWFFISKTFKLNAIRLHLAFASCHQGSANWFAITLSLWRAKKSFFCTERRNKTCLKKGFVFISKQLSIILLQEPDKLINVDTLLIKSRNIKERPPVATSTNALLPCHESMPWLGGPSLLDLLI